MITLQSLLSTKKQQQLPHAKPKSYGGSEVRQFLRKHGKLDPSVDESRETQLEFYRWVESLPKPLGNSYCFSAIGFHPKGLARTGVGGFMTRQLCAQLGHSGLKRTPGLPVGVCLAYGDVVAPYHCHRHGVAGTRFRFHDAYKCHWYWLEGQVAALEEQRDFHQFCPEVIAVIEARLNHYKHCLETKTIYEPAMEVPLCKPRQK